MKTVLNMLLMTLVMVLLGSIKYAAAPGVGHEGPPSGTRVTGPRIEGTIMFFCDPECGLYNNPMKFIFMGECNKSVIGLVDDVSGPFPIPPYPLPSQITETGLKDLVLSDAPNFQEVCSPDAGLTDVIIDTVKSIDVFQQNNTVRADVILLFLEPLKK